MVDEMKYQDTDDDSPFEYQHERMLLVLANITANVVRNLTSNHTY
jgi:ribosomal protein L11 methylase PrmA